MLPVAINACRIISHIAIKSEVLSEMSAILTSRAVSIVVLVQLMGLSGEWYMVHAIQEASS